MSVKVVVPELGESIVEATVGRWLKQAGDPVAVGDILVSLETDKVDVEVGAEKSGVLARIEAEEGQDVKIGDVLAVIEEGEPAAAAEVPTAETKKPEESEAAEEPRPAEAPEQAAERRPAEPAVEAPAADGQKERSGPERVTPVARRMAEDQGLDLAGVQGSGPGGRITKQDVAGRARRQEAATPPPARPATAAPSGETAPAEERVRMSRRRRTIAARLVEAQRTAAMLTTFNEVDMGAVIDLRKRRQEEFRARHDVKLGFMSFFVKAAVSALREFPRLNAEIDGDEIVLKRYYNIGMAVGAEEGLVVPVLHDAGRMSFAEIEQRLRDYVDKVQAGTLALDDLRGGTFTITNGGVFGSLLSTPILNPPEVAILGLHKIEERPVAVDGEVVVRPMMYLALSYDHRLVDGREAVQFLVRIKEFIEDPGRLLLEA